MQAERTTGLTYADWLALGEHKQRHELIGGELIVPPTPSVQHQEVVTEIGMRLLEHARAYGGKAFFLPLDVKLTDTDVVQPDALYLRPESLERLTERGLLGPPDLAVEVLSPWTKQLEQTRKRRLYEQHGVLEYWVVDPEADRVDVYLLKEGRFGLPSVLGPGDTLHPSVMPGLAIPIADVLRPRLNEPS
jgi:Uma2 family endonuclease